MVGTKRVALVTCNLDSNNEETSLDKCFSWTNDREILECFACLTDEKCYLTPPGDMVEDNFLDIENIKQQQDADNELLQLSNKYPECHMHKCINTIDYLLCCIRPVDPPKKLQTSFTKEQISLLTFCLF
jgi:hypothetical protein